MTTQGPAPTPGGERDFADIPPQRSTVVIWIVITLALLLGVIALLLYRSVSAQEPRRTLTVKGNAAWLGTKLTLSDRAGTPVHIAYINPSGQHSVTFFVAPERYVLHISYEDGPELFRQEFDLTSPAPAEYLELPAAPPATQPTTSP